MRRTLSVVLSLAVAGCATTVGSGPVTGNWGGQHVGLVLDAAGGRLDYDCAAGTIDGPLVPDAGGRFAATGRHTPALGGPEQVGVVRPSHPARYNGRVRGDTMTLTVDVAAMGARFGPYPLRRGAEPTLMRCL